MFSVDKYAKFSALSFVSKVYCYKCYERLLYGALPKRLSETLMEVLQYLTNNPIVYTDCKVRLCHIQDAWYFINIDFYFAHLTRCFQDQYKFIYRLIMEYHLFKDTDLDNTTFHTERSTYNPSSTE